MAFSPVSGFFSFTRRIALPLCSLVGTLVCVQAAAADELFSRKVAKDQVLVAKSEKAFSVLLQGEGEVHATAFVLTHPSRLVVDAKGMKDGWNVATNLKDPFVRKIRIGSHPDKVRLVLELVDGASPKPVVEATEGAVKITFSSDKEGGGVLAKSAVRAAKGAAKTAKSAVHPVLAKDKDEADEPEDGDDTPAVKVAPPTPVHEVPVPKSVSVTPTFVATPIVVRATHSAHDRDEEQHKIVELTLAPATPMPPTAVPATATPVPTKVPTAAPTPTAVVVPTKEGSTHSAKESSPSKAPTTLVDQKVPESKTEQMLESIHFLKGASKKEAFIELKFTKEPDRGVLQRKDDTTYVLTVPNSGLATLGLALPQYPPEGFDGIMFVHAQGGDPELEVTVAIDRGTAVTSSVEGNTLTIKSVAK